MADLSIYDKLRTLADYQNANKQANFEAQQKLRGTNAPSAVQEWQFYNQLPPEVRTQYLEMKRSNAPLDLGSRYAKVDPVTGQRIWEQQIDLAPEQLPSTKAAQTRAVTRAGEEEKRAQEAIGDLPKMEEGANYMLSVLRKLEQHPNRTAVTGLRNPLKGAIPFTNMSVPGSSAADVQAIIDQIQGGQFLQAYETLKGGGVITEIEGEKATKAQARMDTAQSDEAFLEGLREYMGVIERGLQRARAKAQDPMLEFQNAVGSMEEISPMTGDLYRRGEQEFNQRKDQRNGVKRMKYNPATGALE